MKQIKIYSLSIAAGLLMYFIGVQSTHAQSDTTLRFLSVSFDTTISSAPLKVSGRLLNIDAVKGLHIVVSPNQNGAGPVVNDTIFILGTNGSYYTSWNKNIKPSRGIRIYTNKVLPSGITGLLYCTITVLYKNGSTGTGRFYTLNRRS
jgi:hypothetical protein